MKAVLIWGSQRGAEPRAPQTCEGPGGGLSCGSVDHVESPAPLHSCTAGRLIGLESSSLSQLLLISCHSHLTAAAPGPLPPCQAGQGPRVTPLYARGRGLNHRPMGSEVPASLHNDGCCRN
ncbi:hypothetical protein AAFF_G00319830 [Aldrovandia affinis]|uniref:Uncharacterized protein n=1 Tax=Aldrovandia affinis TaxID=143900 RepID=A0AAD7WQP4_9TELE|nr:hypothetical protein AAFF_G00319830 [Aldrovandia affinis]